jgi:sugar phosphate isomerase/epimerase
MKVGVFTALLSQLPLDEGLRKMKAFQIDTMELGTGNYPDDAHCKLSMLDNTTTLTASGKRRGY